MLMNELSNWQTDRRFATSWTHNNEYCKWRTELEMKNERDQDQMWHRLEKSSKKTKYNSRWVRLLFPHFPISPMSMMKERNVFISFYYYTNLNLILIFFLFSSHLTINRVIMNTFVALQTQSIPIRINVCENPSTSHSVSQCCSSFVYFSCDMIISLKFISHSKVLFVSRHWDGVKCVLQMIVNSECSKHWTGITNTFKF